MSKVHSQTRITDNKGTARFQSYCANHEPQISWKPTPNDDIGIDGEVELFDEQGKPLSELIKIQLKSTEKDNSYIKNENPNNSTFTFYAEKSHVEYWQKLPNDVLLVIYDNRDKQEKLYAKKIENIDIRNIGTKSVPIQFNKNSDLIDENNKDFLEKFSRLYNDENPTIKEVAKGTETLVTNLLKITFPTNKIYIAPINYDRDKIIENSWNTNKPVGYKASAREVARSALHQQGLNFSSDWAIHNKKIITFHDLNNGDLPLSKIVENPIDELTPQELYSVNEDYNRVFKSLIKFCLQQMLYKIGYEWQYDEEIFRVIAPLILKDKLEIQQGWKGDKKATRTIFKANYYEKFNVYYCQHFAFSIDIKDFDDDWFLCINPTWTVSINGKQKSQVSHKRVKALKRMERNKSVYNHLRFIAYELSHRDLFIPEYPFLSFNGLEKTQTDKVIDEVQWLQTEEADEINVLKDSEEPSELQDENKLF
ncbi:MAG TPA: DUF4365 domain-containing protein [Pyrinomonadaceae bacterium]|jgi:hypothetical protein